jgi:hypothetical protein
MDQLNVLYDKLDEDMQHLALLMDCDDLTPEGARIALQVAKRVRRNATVLIGHLAALRDNQQLKS